MPPPKIPQPNFSPYGRYLIDVDNRKEHPTFHDTYNTVEACKIESMNTASMSRFDTKDWAIRRGFKACSFCKE